MLIGVTLLFIIVLLLVGPIKQDSSFHLFADSRSFADTPNFMNIVSNLPFIMVGFSGVRLLARAPLIATDAAVKTIYLLFFVGVALTGFGSMYYHYAPDNSRLLWDRLPMTVTFMAFFCAIIGECISPLIAWRLVLPLLTFGLASTGYWYLTEVQGHGDLRAYVLVQFLPVMLLPLILWLYDGNRKGCRFVWAVLGAYLLAKMVELMDAEIYNHLHFISGHSLKHLLAGLGTYIVFTTLRQRFMNLENKPL